MDNNLLLETNPLDIPAHTSVAKIKNINTHIPRLTKLPKTLKPAELRRLIVKFGIANWKWSFHEYARHNCIEASFAFQEFLEDCGHRTAVKVWQNMQRVKSKYPINVGMYDTDHMVNRAGNLYIDWTARQFLKSAKFPTVWVMESKSK